jgi:type I restriction enzyme S subunit
MSSFPTGWMTASIEDLMERIIDYRGKTPSKTDSGIPLITAKIIKEGRIGEPTEFIAHETYSPWMRRGLPQRGDVLITTEAPLGEVAQIFNEKVALAQRVILLRGKAEELNNSYLKYVLQSKDVQKQLITKSTGTTVLGIKQSELRKVLIPLPPLEEQRRIAAILDKADAVRRKRKEAIALTEELLRSAFLEMFGDPVTNPKGWEMKPLGKLCTVRRGASPRPIDAYLGGSVPWVKIGDGTGSDDIYIHKTAEAVTPEGAKKSVYLEPGSLIFANCGVSLGFARILGIGGCIHDGWLSFSDISESLDKIYLLKLLNSVTNHFRQIAPSGTQPNLNTGIMKEFSIPIPPIQLQLEFADVVEKISSEKQHQSEALEATENLFNSLLQRAFRGEL